MMTRQEKIDKFGIEIVEQDEKIWESRGYKINYSTGLLETINETRIYMIPVDEMGSDDYTDEQFISIAEQAGTVYSLKGFQDAFNYTEDISLDNYIRII
jgi:hypothetical protein